jgi:hypothetical protein
MAKTNPSTIILKGDPILKEYPLEDLDAYGVGAIKPGMLVEETSTGTVQPHSTASGNASPLFAVEALNLDPDSKTMGGIDDEYDTDGQAVKVGFFRPGDEVYALLAAGNDVARGALLESAGDGSLQAFTVSGATPRRPVARAKEAKDNDPGTGGAAVRIKVEVL